MKKFLLTMLSLILMQSVTFADAKREIAVNQLPAMAQKFLKTHFSHQTVNFVLMESQWGGAEYQVRLADGTKIEFNRKGEWVDIECEKGVVPNTIVPKISEYVAKRYKDVRIVKIERDKRNYDVELSNDLELRFNSRFELVNIDD